MGLNHRFLASFALLIALSLNSLLSMGFHVDDLDYYTALGQRNHALSLLPNASMLQAADTCGPGHFHYDETYGYWVQDFQIILRSDSARADLQRLVRQPKVVGQLYGLAGLWLLDSAAYGEARAQLEFRDTLIGTAEDCEWQERPLSGELLRIESGHWPRALIRAPIDVH